MVSTTSTWRGGRASSAPWRERRRFRCPVISPRLPDSRSARGGHMKTIKGPAIFLAQFAGDAAPFNWLASIARWAADLGYKGVQIPSWDGRLFDLDQGRRERGLLRRGQGHAQGRRHRDDRAVDPPAGPAGRRASGLRRGLRRVRRARGARQPQGAPGMGGRADAHGGRGLAGGWARRPRHLLRRARLALSLPVAAAAGGADRHRVRRAGPALEADPRRVRRGTASTSATRCIRARI